MNGASWEHRSGMVVLRAANGGRGWVVWQYTYFRPELFTRRRLGWFVLRDEAEAYVTRREFAMGAA